MLHPPTNPFAELIEDEVVRDGSNVRSQRGRLLVITSPASYQCNAWETGFSETSPAGIPRRIDPAWSASPILLGSPISPRDHELGVSVALLRQVPKPVYGGAAPRSQAAIVQGCYGPSRQASFKIIARIIEGTMQCAEPNVFFGSAFLEIRNHRFPIGVIPGCRTQFEMQLAPL